jgi:hypothetical protein
VGKSGSDVKFLPYHRFEFQSPFKQDAAIEAMAKHVEPMKWFRWRWPSSGNDERFEGEMTPDGFKGHRVIGYRNSFLPQLQIVVSSEARGSRVQVTMQLHPLIWIFVAVWAMAFIVIAPTLLIASPDVIATLLTFLAFAAVYAMTMGGFWFEANKQEATLRGIFQAG